MYVLALYAPFSGNVCAVARLGEEDIGFDIADLRFDVMFVHVAGLEGVWRLCCVVLVRV